MTLNNHRFHRLSQALQYAFQNPELLRQALTHRSYGAVNNERLEFVGDSILNYTIARMLYDQFPTLAEGELSRLRANLVNQNTLAEIAHELKLGECLYLGEGELKSAGFNRSSILADALEATFAAVSFDSNFLRAEQVVRRLYVERVLSIDSTSQAKDAKTLLQEALQARKLALPIYRILSKRGKAHDQWFTVQCDLGAVERSTTGEGGNRRAAEQQAAEMALILLEKKFDADKRRI